MIGENLKKIRQKKRITQQQLAEQLGVSRQAVCLWEADKREVKVSILQKISRILKVNVNEIIRVIEHDKKAVHFEFQDDAAQEVLLTGDFTHWQKPLRLRRSAKGVWRKKIDLKPGRYEYKFIVDGEWRIDPNNTKNVYNSIGTLNSVAEF